MKRALPWILTILALGSVLGGLYALGQRKRTPPPVLGPQASSLFTAQPMGRGALLQLTPAPDQPLRGVRFLPPVANGVVLAQVLTQTGDQWIAKFNQGSLVDSLRLDAPSEVPFAFFRFAKLQDAASLGNGSLLLLYTDGTGGSSAPWLLYVDPAARKVQGCLKITGNHLALVPGDRACLSWDAHSLARINLGPKLSTTPIPLPDEVHVVDAVLATPDGRVMVAHPGGLAIQTGDTWTQVPLTAPSELLFPGTPGVLAATGKEVFWQPRPGQLMKVASDGTVSPVDLATLQLPGGRERDASLLRLAGADPRGRIWFTLSTPDFSVAPHPSVDDQPSAALRATAALAGHPMESQEKPPVDVAAWTDYLKGGLDRAYAWDPKGTSLRLVDWKGAWSTLGAPSDFSLPLPQDLQPQGGALLLDQDTRAWWLPLDQVAP